MAGLANGTPFPELEIARVGGGTFFLPDLLAGDYGVVLAFRGAWCRRCNAQLKDFAEHSVELVAARIGIAAFSTDEELQATEMVARNEINFPVGYGVDLKTTSAALQSYVNDAHHSLESSNFLLRPDGSIELAVYSSGPIGRLVPRDVIDIVARRRSDENRT